MGRAGNNNCSPVAETHSNKLSDVVVEWRESGKRLRWQSSSLVVDELIVLKQRAHDARMRGCPLLLEGLMSHDVFRTVGKEFLRYLGERNGALCSERTKPHRVYWLPPMCLVLQLPFDALDVIDLVRIADLDRDGY